MPTNWILPYKGGMSKWQEKSRKQIAVEEPVVESVSSEVFSTAIYARLSVENSGKSEKVDVIANQIEICKSYIAERPYLNLIDTYVDNGRTGTVFDRPEFNRLMNDIRTGRIKCLVVRDLSRFGRDYIEAGTYLERVFPQIGLRFIAIKENYDNFDTDGSGESLIILCKHDQHPLLEGHLPQGFYRAQGTDGKRRVQEAKSPVWLSLG